MVKLAAMRDFDPARLRDIRIARGMSGIELAKCMEVSPAQIHRLEKGDRRLTVDTLLRYCDALNISVGQLFAPNSLVPVTGVIDSDFEIQPLPPNAPDQILAPPLVEDMSQLAVVRWAASRRFAPMRDHAVFYNRHEQGVPDFAWDKRCVIVRADGSQCLGWPTRQSGSVHINVGSGPVEFDVEVVWASAVVAVMPPFAIDALQPPI